ncbi:MAG TPA: hypothetical protein VE967_10245, partial [Gemmatimonadaceae bacterium]|nr:hypothetical protein [Gemmatimonadaceae bacterium]
LSELDQRDYDLSWRSGEACDKLFGITARVDNGSLFSIQPITPTFETVTDGGKTTRMWDADVHVWSLLPGQTNVHLDFTYGGRKFKTYDIGYTATPTRGDVTVNFTGIPTGLLGNVYVGLGREDGRSFTASGTARFLPGDLSYQANTINGQGGAVFHPMPSAGIITSTVGGSATLNIAYAPEAGSTGTVNVQVGGLAPGLNGNVIISGNGISPMTFNATGTVNLPVGNYTAQINNVSNANVDEADPAPTRNFSVTAGQTYNLLVAYAVVARLVQFQVAGLLAGLNPDVSFTRTGQTAVNLLALSFATKMAVGAWNVSGGDRAMNGHTYRLVSNLLLGLTIASGFDPLVVQVVYYQALWAFTVQMGWACLSGDDPFGHFNFVGFLLASYILNVTRTFPAQAAGPGGLAAQQTGTETVTITGPSPFITVTGTRAADGTLNLTGSGTAAGFSNVPVLMTGNMSNTNVFTNNGTTGGAKYRVGQPTAPTGLPNGPITYTLTGSGPASLQAVFQK